MSEDFPILAAVATAPTHAFEVLEHLQSFGLRMSRSTLYRRVEALIGEGWLAVEPGQGGRGHVRRDLLLTQRGSERLAPEAAEVLRAAPLESPGFALAIEAARVVGEAALGEILRSRLARAARELTREERSLREGPVEAWRAVTRERQAAHLRADIAWLQSVLGRRLIVERTQPEERPLAS